ncbi:MAG TPA: nucleoside triphosphate pyrophosphatase [Gemmataceae bacterium]|jgi:septum formation protein|nr:nucleoside triphosphate pyrophosphatase [Gemmataceae bacterium]
MAKQLPFRLILASASLGRRELLQRAGYAFDVIPSHIDEPNDAGYPDARSLVQHVAWLKAAAVAAQGEKGVILAADSIGWIEGTPICKPTDEADARRILRLLAGRTHQLWTGVCLWRQADGLQIAWQESSDVHFAALDASGIEKYLQTRLWEGCAGAYAVLERDDPYVQVTSGSISNVIGLPMESLERRLPMIESP